MSLLDDAIADSSSKGLGCVMGAWIAGLSPKDRAEVLEAVNAPTTAVQHAALARAIKKRWPDGPTVHSVTRHRKRECSCGAD
jgi:hypothetical protein